MKQLQQIVDDIVPSAKKRKKLPVFVLFVFISTILWLLIKLSGDYSIGLSLPVNYEEIPSEKLLAEVNDPNLKFTINSRGFVILKVKYFSKVRAATLSLAQIPYRKRSQTEYYINTNNLREYLARAYRINETDIFFDDTELRFMLEDLHAKRVPVIAELNISYKQEFLNYANPVILPDSVVIYGSSQVLDTIYSIRTSKLQLTDVAYDINTTLGLIHNHNIRVVPNTVDLMVDVERFTETSLTLPITKPNVRPGIRTFPENVTASFLVSLKDYPYIQPSDFEIGIDTAGLYKNRPTLKVEIISYPKVIQNLRIEPSSVEYIRVR
jgi:hypothetical protein